MRTRRWFLFCPCQGRPEKAGAQDRSPIAGPLSPATLSIFSAQEELRGNLKKNPRPFQERGNAVFAEKTAFRMSSMVDAGTIETWSAARV